MTKLAEKQSISSGKLTFSLSSIPQVNQLFKSLVVFDEGLVESYFDKANLAIYLQDWYQIVQRANAYMQDQAPWVKLKSTNPETVTE